MEMSSFEWNDVIAEKPYFPAGWSNLKVWLFQFQVFFCTSDWWPLTPLIRAVSSQLLVSSGTWCLVRASMMVSIQSSPNAKRTSSSETGDVSGNWARWGRTKGWGSMFRFGIRFYGRHCWCHGVLWWMTPMMKKYSSSTIGWGIPCDDCLFLHFLRSQNPRVVRPLISLSAASLSRWNSVYWVSFTSKFMLNYSILGCLNRGCLNRGGGIWKTVFIWPS